VAHPSSLFFCNAGKKLGGADNELLPIALEHYGRLPWGQGRAAQDGIELSAKLHLLSYGEAAELQVVLKGINFFHYSVFHITYRVKA